MKRIPVSMPYIPSHAYTYLKDCLDTGWLSSQGPYVKQFEESFASYHGVSHAISSTSGTAALHLALAAGGISTGDEVIITTFTMIAPVYAVLYVGATPRLVDCEHDTWNMDVKKIKEKITKKTKAILVVHIYGHPVDMDKVMDIAKKYNLLVIEDAAEALGALYKNEKAGTIGDIGCFSFYANKLITTGEGGMVITNNDTFAEKIRSLKDMAHSPKKRFLHTDLAFNYRLTNLQSAVGLAYLEKIDRYNEKKRAIADMYNTQLKNVSWLTLPVEKKWAKNSYWMYGILIDIKKISKENFMKYLAEKGIETRDFFIPMHMQPALLDLGLFHHEVYPTAEEISERGLYLPSGPNISKKEILFVCKTVTDLNKSL